jgi:hypothetical protein
LALNFLYFFQDWKFKNVDTFWEKAGVWKELKNFMAMNGSISYSKRNLKGFYMPLSLSLLGLNFFTFFRVEKFKNVDTFWEKGSLKRA